VFAILLVTVSALLVALSYSQLLNARTAEQAAVTEMAVLKLRAEQAAAPPEREVITEYKEIDRSFVYNAMWNWVAPTFAFILAVYVTIVGAMELYNRYGRMLASDGFRSYSVFSASVSMVGMIFAVLRFRRDLLEHEVGAYVFFSCAAAFLFFMSLIFLKGKLIASIIYVCVILLPLATGWFASGEPFFVVDELRSYLATLPAPYQALVVLGIAAPVLLVIVAYSKLGMRTASRSA
jgi:hypothetical protein